MIGEKKYKDVIQEVEALIGQIITKEQRKAIFGRIQGLHEQDFINACNDEDFLREASKFKFSYPLLRGYIARHAEIRTMKETEEQKKTDAIALRKLLADDKTPDSVKAFLRGYNDIEVKNVSKRGR